MSHEGDLNLRWTLQLFQGLAEGGANHAVISPGGRSTPLALAAARHPGFQIHVHADERSAAFFALGLAKRSGRPAVVVGTSGTAPAHWFPALIEAAHTDTPLILLSADRPPEDQACGAAQTIDQRELFGKHVRHCQNLGPAKEGDDAMRERGLEAVRNSLGPIPGPVHLNIHLREPLAPEGEVALPGPVEMAPLQPAVGPAPRPKEIARLAEAITGRPGLIICGRPSGNGGGFPPAVTALAMALGAPILADPLSSLRFGGHNQEAVLTRYDALLRHPPWAADNRPDWVIRFGALPVSKALTARLAEWKPDPFILVEPFGRPLDPTRSAAIMAADPTRLAHALAAEGPEPGPPEWLDRWRTKNRQALPETLPDEAFMMVRLLEKLPPDSLFFCGNGLPIRDLDAFSGRGRNKLLIQANRGVNGIDGNLSTFLGMAAAHGEAGKAVALVGDLAFFHDLNGLAAARGGGGLDAVIVVVNNGGGGIFDLLAPSGLPEFEQLWLADPGADFRHVGPLFGLDYLRVEQTKQFDAAFADALARPGTTLIEVIVDRPASLELRKEYWSSVADAL